MAKAPVFRGEKSDEEPGRNVKGRCVDGDHCLNFCIDTEEETVLILSF